MPGRLHGLARVMGSLSEFEVIGLAAFIVLAVLVGGIVGSILLTDAAPFVESVRFVNP